MISGSGISFGFGKSCRATRRTTRMSGMPAEKEVEAIARQTRTQADAVLW